MSNIIDQCEKVKDLRVIMNDQATVKDHIEKALSKARQKMGWILRTFRTKNKWFMKHMFKNLVLPHIDYCSQLWMPVDADNIHSLEKFQWDFFKKIADLRSLNYWEALRDMKMLSLQKRLERYRVIYMWKFLEKFAPNCGIFKIKGSEKNY